MELATLGFGKSSRLLDVSYSLHAHARSCSSIFISSESLSRVKSYKYVFMANKSTMQGHRKTSQATL